MSGDIEGWLNIVDRLDVWALALMTVFGFIRVVASLNKIERALAIQTRELERLDEWREEHTADDRAEHRRLYDQMRGIPTL